MKRREIIGLIAIFILFLIAISLGDRIKFPPHFESVFAIGVLWILIMPRIRSRFESKKIVLFMYLGIIFPFLDYIMVFVILENYPNLTMFIAPVLVLFALLAVIFTGLAADKMIKELSDRFKK